MSKVKKSWYELNRKKRSEDRKKKYREDTEYREKIKAKYSQAYYDKKSKLPDHPDDSILIENNGNYIVTYPLKAVARKLEVSYYILRSKKSAGLIPNSPYKTKGKGWLLYTDKMITGIGKCIKSGDWTKIEKYFQI